MIDKVFAAEVARRLRVAARELGYKSAQELADWLGANRPQVSAWFNYVALPPVKYMRRLAERGITLDWIYRGDGSGLSNALYIRLTAAMEADEPPPDVAPEPEPTSDAPAYPLRKAGTRVRKVEAVGPETERPKRASAA